MCIICNMGDDEIGMRAADRFLDMFESARGSMKAATHAMLEVSRHAATPEDRKRYDAVHKQMVKMTADWNKIEQKREHESAQAP